MPYFLALITVILWGSTSAVGTMMLKSVSTMALVFWGGLIASIFLFFSILCTGKFSLFRALKMKEFLAILGAGSLGIFAYDTLLYYGMTRIQAQQAFIINYLWPIFVVIFSCIIVKEKITIPIIISMALSFLGVAVVATKGNLEDFGNVDFLGSGSCVVAAVCYGLFSALTLKIATDKVIAMFLYYAITTVLSLISLFLTGEGLQMISSSTFLGMLWVGVMVNGVAYTFWTIALKNADTARISNMAYLTPFLSLIWIYFMVGEKIEISSIIGLLIILLGMAIQIWWKKKEKTEKAIV